MFFTYGLVLSRFDGVAAAKVGLYLLPFTLSNFLGAAVLARLFDTVGRRPMITATYGLSGLLMIGAAGLFRIDALTAVSQTLAWAAIFFLASAGASAAYLTVSEAFPLEIRARAIALFYALGTATGGILAPALFAILIASGSRTQVFVGLSVGRDPHAARRGRGARLGLRRRRPLAGGARHPVEPRRAPTPVAKVPSIPLIPPGIFPWLYPQPVETDSSGSRLFALFLSPPLSAGNRHGCPTPLS